MPLRGVRFLACAWNGLRNLRVEALNPKQIPIAKFKVQTRFGHFISFSISDLVFSIQNFVFVGLPRFARNDGVMEAGSLIPLLGKVEAGFIPASTK